MKFLNFYLCKAYYASSILYIFPFFRVSTASRIFITSLKFTMEFTRPFRVSIATPTFHHLFISSQSCLVFPHLSSIPPPLVSTTNQLFIPAIITSRLIIILLPLPKRWGVAMQQSEKYFLIPWRPVEKANLRL